MLRSLHRRNCGRAPEGGGGGDDVEDGGGVGGHGDGRGGAVSALGDAREKPLLQVVLNELRQTVLGIQKVRDYTLNHLLT